MNVATRGDNGRKLRKLLRNAEKWRGAYLLFSPLRTCSYELRRYYVGRDLNRGGTKPLYCKCEAHPVAEKEGGFNDATR